MNGNISALSDRVKQGLVLFVILSLAAAAFLVCQAPPAKPKTQLITQNIPSAVQSIPADEIVPEPPKKSAPTTPSSWLVPLTRKAATVKERLAPEILARLAAPLESNDTSVLVSILGDPDDDDTVRNEVANILRQMKYGGLEEVLAGVLANPVEKSRFRSFAAQHLGEMLNETTDPDRSMAITQILYIALEDRAVEVQREAVLPLAHLRDLRALKRVMTWLNCDPPAKDSDEVRDVAVRYVQELGMRECLPRVRALCGDSRESVRIAAINALAQWCDDQSSGLFQAASMSSSPRIQRAGRAALARLNSLDRVLPPESRNLGSLIAALGDKQPQRRNSAAVLLVSYGGDAYPASGAVADALDRIDPASATGQIIAYLDVLRNAGLKAKVNSQILLKLLDERSPIYLNREKSDVHMLRAYILLTLSDIGAARDAVENIAESLANSDDEMVFNFAAAANAVRSLGKEGRAFIPYLTRVFDPGFKDQTISLKSYYAAVTPANATSARLETIRALASMNELAADALPALSRFMKNYPPNPQSALWNEGHALLQFLEKSSTR